MFAHNTPAPTIFSDTPLIQPTTPAGKVPRPAVVRQPSRRRRGGLINSDRIQQFAAATAALPAIAGVLLLVNHCGTVWRWFRGVGVIDTIALSCLAVSALLAAPRVITATYTAFSTLCTAVIRLPEMADNIVVLSSTVDLVLRDPAPRHWLDMYYNMVSDIDSLLQEMIQMRALMADLHSDVEHVKEKTPFVRKGHKHDKK